MEITRQTLRERQLALIRHYLDRLEDFNQMMARGKGHAENALRSFDQEWHQLQVQQQQAVLLAARDKQAAALVSAFPDKATYLLSQVDTSVALRWLDDALAWAGEEDTLLQFNLYRLRYQIHKMRRDVARMGEVLNKLEALAEQLNDDVQRARVAQLSTWYYDMAEDYPRALTQAEHALMLAFRLEDTYEIAQAYSDAGTAFARLEQFTQSDDFLNMALDLFRQHGYRRDEGLTLNSLAINAYGAGRHTDAVDYAEQALVIVREFGQRDTELLIQGNLSLFTMGIGDLEKAHFYARQALAASRATGAGDTEESALAVLMLVAAQAGLVDEARLYFNQAQALLDEMPSSVLHSSLAYARWLVAHEQGEFLDACEPVRAGAEAAREADIPDQAFTLLAALGCSLLELNRLDEAAEAFERCMELRGDDYGQPFDLSIVLTGLSYVEARRGNMHRAQTLLEKFFALPADKATQNIETPSIVIWNAYQAALALKDSRAPELSAIYEAVLAVRLAFFHDDHLRASYLNQMSVRRMLALRAAK